MSETEHITGKLTPIATDDDIESKAISLLKERGEEIECYYSNACEQLEDVCDEFVIVDDIIYQVEMTKNDPYNDIFKARKNADNTIDFEVKYYNGGCGFSEAIEMALKTIKP